METLAVGSRCAGDRGSPTSPPSTTTPSSSRCSASPSPSTSSSSSPEKKRNHNDGGGRRHFIQSLQWPPQSSSRRFTPVMASCPFCNLVGTGHWISFIGRQYLRIRLVVLCPHSKTSSCWSLVFVLI